MATWRWNKTHFRSRSLAEIAMLSSMLHIIWNLKLQHLRCNIKKSSQYPLSEIICSGLDDKSKNWQQTLPPNWLGGRIKTFFQAWDFLEILRKIYLDLLYPGKGHFRILTFDFAFAVENKTGEKSNGIKYS